MKAYKVFNPDWTCKGFKYKVGETYEIESDLILCKKGFHACKNPSDCFNYYSFDPKNKVAEVELLGDIQGLEEDKQATNKIKIIREIEWSEVLIICNSGNHNSGNWNSGYQNSGNQNSGNWNSGDRNSGNQNSGDHNSGNWNSGDHNSGHRNSGNWNSGDHNSGHRNSGNQNFGNWNSGDHNSGLFNTDEPNIRMFNKNTKKKFGDLNIPYILYFGLTQWVSHDTATEEEKVKYKTEIETCGGFLKTLDYKEAFKRSWENGSEEDKEAVKNLPNFDADIFFEISGIRV